MGNEHSVKNSSNSSFGKVSNTSNSSENIKKVLSGKIITNLNVFKSNLYSKSNSKQYYPYYIPKKVIEFKRSNLKVKMTSERILDFAMEVNSEIPKVLTEYINIDFISSGLNNNEIDNRGDINKSLSTWTDINNIDQVKMVKNVFFLTSSHDLSSDSNKNLKLNDKDVLFYHIKNLKDTIKSNELEEKVKNFKYEFENYEKIKKNTKIPQSQSQIKISKDGIKEKNYLLDSKLTNKDSSLKLVKIGEKTNPISKISIVNPNKEHTSKIKKIAPDGKSPESKLITSKPLKNIKLDLRIVKDKNFKSQSPKQKTDLNQSECSSQTHNIKSPLKTHENFKETKFSMTSNLKKQPTNTIIYKPEEIREIRDSTNKKDKTEDNYDNLSNLITRVIKPQTTTNSNWQGNKITYIDLMKKKQEDPPKHKEILSLKTAENKASSRSLNKLEDKKPIPKDIKMIMKELSASERESERVSKKNKNEENDFKIKDTNGKNETKESFMKMEINQTIKGSENHENDYSNNLDNNYTNNYNFNKNNQSTKQNETIAKLNKLKTLKINLNQSHNQGHIQSQNPGNNYIHHNFNQFNKQEPVNNDDEKLSNYNSKESVKSPSFSVDYGTNQDENMNIKQRSALTVTPSNPQKHHVHRKSNSFGGFNSEIYDFNPDPLKSYSKESESREGEKFSFRNPVTEEPDVVMNNLNLNVSKLDDEINDKLSNRVGVKYIKPKIVKKLKEKIIIDEKDSIVDNSEQNSSLMTETENSTNKSDKFNPNELQDFNIKNRFIYKSKY